jgi:hypothetical protein
VGHGVLIEGIGNSIELTKPGTISDEKPADDQIVFRKLE